MITHIIKLIGWKHLVFLALAQCFIKYGLLESFTETHGIVTTLSHFQFSLLVFACLCIAAAGHVTHAIYTVDADEINAPECVIINKSIPENLASTLFIAFNIIGVGIGYYLSHAIDKSGFFVIFIMASALLYVHSTFLKSIAGISALTIGVVVALGLLTVPTFDLLPAISPFNKSTQLFFFSIVLDYAILAGLLTIVCVLVEELKATNGHYNTGINTLSVVMGRERASKVTFIIALVPLFAVVFYIIAYLFKQTTVVIYALVFVVAPLLYIAIKLFNASTNKHYKHISLVLKMIMLSVIISLFLYKYILI